MLPEKPLTRSIQALAVLTGLAVTGSVAWKVYQAWNPTSGAPPDPVFGYAVAWGDLDPGDLPQGQMPNTIVVQFASKKDMHDSLGRGVRLLPANLEATQR
jgi:hypothetical protein